MRWLICSFEYFGDIYMYSRAAESEEKSRGAADGPWTSGLKPFFLNCSLERRLGLDESSTASKLLGFLFCESCFDI